MLTPLDRMQVWAGEQVVERVKLLAALDPAGALPEMREVLDGGLATVPASATLPAYLVLTEDDAGKSAVYRAEDVPENVRQAVKRLRHEIRWFQQFARLAEAVTRDNWDLIDWYKAPIKRPPGRTFEERQEALR